MNLIYLKACRLCAASRENTVPIFEKTGIVNLAEKIKSYLHVEIKNLADTNDEPRMCYTCYKKILSWDRYAEQVRKVQGMFTSWADKEGNKLVKNVLSEMKVSNEELDAEEADRKSEKANPRKRESAMDICSKASALRAEKCDNKKETIMKNDDDNFSDEDDIPLAEHISAPTDNKNEIKSKRMKPKIKLKIKAIKKGDLSMSEKHVEKCEVFNLERLENNDGSIDENKLNTLPSTKTSGLLSLFNWECVECQAFVKNWNALVKHCKEVHKSSASVRCVCGKILQSRASVVKHRTKHTVGYEYKCQFGNCNKTFHRQQLLDVHSLSHVPKELQPWMCCKCSRRFHTESLLKQHEKVHLPKEEKLIHPCEVCQKKFCSKSAVASHIRAVHFGERPYVCDQCGHSFTSKGILHEHLTIHSDVYNFHCEECKKSFKTKYRLKIHMDTHVETRYQCPVCTLTLNTRRTLRMHLLVHKDDKAFQCTTCGKAFKRSKDLKNHYNLHTGRRPYTCPFCQRTFANGSNCRSHKRRMHPEELKMYEAAAAAAAGQQNVVFQNEEPFPGNGRPDLDSDESEPEIFRTQIRDSKSPGESVRSSDPDTTEAGEGGARVQRPFFEPSNALADYDEIKLEKEEEEKQEATAAVAAAAAASTKPNEGENLAVARIGLQTQVQTLACAPHQFYSFQSSGIPAFPGNPFYRQ